VSGAERITAISTGAYGYPLDAAATLAVGATAAALERHPAVVEAQFWLFDGRSHSAFERALGAT